MLICSLFFSSLLCLEPIPPPEPPYIELCARVTCYEPTGYRTASMKNPRNGMVATSDRSIKFGTKVIAGGKEYVVEDRTNKRLQALKYPTIDVFMESGCSKQVGVRYEKVIIYK